MIHISYVNIKSSKYSMYVYSLLLYRFRVGSMLPQFFLVTYSTVHN